MTASDSVVLIIQTFAVLSVLLVCGVILRAKVKIFQKLYLPACVIGGFVGLLLGPNVLDILPISEDMMSAVSALPSVLFIPVIAALPVCSGKIDFKNIKKQKAPLICAAVICLGFTLQYAVGLLVNLLSDFLGTETYPTFGLELAMGFGGSHGQVGAVGGMLEALEQPYYQTAMGVTSTTATVGILGGLIIGTFMINMAIRRNYTVVVKDISAVPKEMSVGYYSRGQKRPSLGEQTMITSSVETLSLHLGLMLLATGGGDVLSNYINKLGWSLLGAIATWVYALLVMYVLWFIIRKCKLDYLFDEKVKNSITGLITDYLIVAAIMSIPVEVVASYWQPLLVMCILGLIMTPLLIYFVCKKCLDEYWFENTLGSLGCLTGQFITGMLLIKMADPDLETPVLADFGAGYTIQNFYCIPLISLMFPFVVSNGPGAGLLLNLGLAVVFTVIIVLIGRMGRKA